MPIRKAQLGSWLDLSLVRILQVGRISPVFADASKMAATIADAAYTYDLGEIFYNKYFTPVKYELTVLPFFNQTRIEVRTIRDSLWYSVHKNIMRSFRVKI